MNSNRPKFEWTVIGTPENLKSNTLYENKLGGLNVQQWTKFWIKNDSNMNLTWEKKKLVDNHDVAVHMEGDLFFIIDTQI